ncbi:MAG: hypothetical protein K8S18_22530 [Desulfobacula sp.]|nr:hypothetical protein [Desulfobacula sp.]
MQWFNDKVVHDEKGSILIAVIVTMVVVSVLGAGLLSITGTSVFNQTGSNSTSNAFHLAEAGYRYVRPHIQTIGDFHNKTFTLAGGNYFTITLKTYDFDITGVSGSEIQTLIPHGSVPFPDISVSGTIAVGSTPYTYSSIDVIADAVNFTISSGGPLPLSGKVKLAALKNGTSTITENSTISFKDSNPLNLFPAHNGNFTIGSEQYSYRSRTENTLIGITAAVGNWPGNFILNDNDPVILDSFIELESTGNYGSAPLASKRLLTYHIALNGGTQDELIDYFDDKDDWSPNTGEGSTGEGTFDTGDIDGDSALIITSATTVIGSLVTSSIDYLWQDTDLDLNDVWSSAGNYLSYNAQVKIKVGDPDPSTYEPVYQNMADNYFYLAGISFRKRDNGDSYGLSYYRAEPDNRDGIPDYLNPFGTGAGNGGQAMVLLWERIGTYGATWRWLAYANLSDVNVMREPQPIFEDDFETDLSNWIQSVPDTFNFETITSHEGDPTQTITDSPGGRYLRNNNYIITSNAINVSGMSSLSLSFWHKYNTERRWDICRVQIRADGGSWQTLATYDGVHNSWEQVSFTLDSLLPANSVQILFSLLTDGSVQRNGWNIDDVKLETLVPKWMTLMLHLEEKDISGTKTNEIKAYVSDETLRGAANDDPQDNNRLNNPRGDVNWPPYDVNDTNSGNDNFTLIKWDGINTGITLTGTGKEQESIIQVDSLTSPDTGTFDMPEIGLHSWGWNYNVTYFDDFAVKTD